MKGPLPQKDPYLQQIAVQLTNEHNVPCQSLRGPGLVVAVDLVDQYPDANRNTQHGA